MMPVVDDEMLGTRMLRMWDDGRDTADIAKSVHRPESVVWKSLIVLREARRRRRVSGGGSTHAPTPEDAPATA